MAVTFRGPPIFRRGSSPLFAALLSWLVALPVLAAEVRYYEVEPGAHPHDVAPAADGRVWYTAQHQGALGVLDPRTGISRLIPLNPGSRPHGVVVGPDGAAWVTDGGQNAILRVDPATDAVTAYPLPEVRDNANLNTAAFDADGVLWFTGQSGVYGSLNPANGDIRVFDAPRGYGPYGITATPDGEIYYASLAGSHIAHIDRASGEARVIEPPTEDQGARRVWSDSKGRIWVSEWNAGQLSVYDPKDESWRTFGPPGKGEASFYAVYVDEHDDVWVTDFDSNAILRFDPETERYESFPSDQDGAAVRQLLGRPGEVWGAESGNDRLVVIRTDASD